MPTMTRLERALRKTYRITVRHCGLHVGGAPDSIHTVRTSDLEATMQAYEVRGLVVVHTELISG
ncbi:MAG TPA: hypothetical protein VNS88_07265 [Nitrospiraceae bacterium]|nr:hypothetical protein [Nitrospiraceae bacterium]